MNANALAEVPVLRTFRTMRTHALLLLTAAVGGCRPGRNEAYARFTGGEPSAAGRVESATAVVGDDLYLFGGFEAGYKATRRAVNAYGRHAGLDATSKLAVSGTCSVPSGFIM